jgi:DNA-binding CsgD family transcriptional regulator
MLDLLSSQTRAEKFSECQLFESTATFAADMGFTYCAYFLQMPMPVSCPPTAMYMNSPDGCIQDTVRHPILSQDPLVRQGLKNMCAFEWNKRSANDSDLPWSDAMPLGFDSGLAHASRDIRGSIGLLKLSAHTEQKPTSYSVVTQMQVTWLAQQCHSKMAERFFQRQVPEADITMTEREREIMSWTADGKTAYEISRILKLAEPTIIFHLNKVAKKLGAVNKTQAVAKAVSLGMLP